MSEINYFNFLFYSGDVAVDVDRFHVKIIHLVNSSYIVIGNSTIGDSKLDCGIQTNNS
jgi:hypothetical protein